jgi:hypothetical protein
MNKFSVLGHGLAVVFFLTACGPAVLMTPATLVPVQSTSIPDVRTLKREARFKLKTGYSRVLAAGSRWKRAGSIAQGSVFRPVDTVFSIEGRQVHEAWLVIRQDELVGFYIPAEGNYSAVDPQLPLFFN